MKLMLRNTLESLNSMVEENLEMVRANSNNIDKLLLLPESESKNQLIRDRYSFNKKLLFQNIEHLEAQLRVAKVLETSKQLRINRRYSADADMIQEIVTGEVEFNEMHPKFNNMEFISMLIEFYRHNDEFEKCIELKRHIKTLV